MAVLQAQLHETPPSLSERRKEELDPALEGLIARAMAKDPTRAMRPPPRSSTS